MKKIFLLVWLFVYMFLSSSVTHAYFMGAFGMGENNKIEQMACCGENDHVSDTKVMKNPCASFLETKNETVNAQVIHILLPMAPFAFFTHQVSLNLHDIISLSNSHSPPIFTSNLKNYSYAQLLGIIKKTI